MTGNLDIDHVRDILIEKGFLNKAPADVAADGQLSPALAEALKRAVVATGNDGALNGHIAIQDGKLSQSAKDIIKHITVTLSQSYCGVKDPAPGTSGIGIKTYGEPQGRWGTNTLTFRIVNANAAKGLSPADVTAEIVDAFGAWTTASNGILTFTQTATAADITVTFGGKALDAQLGAAGGVLGIGGYPGTNNQGQLNLDSAETWTKSMLYIVALHEIGHILGLRHDNSKNSIMYPYNRSNLGAFPAVDRNSQEALLGVYGWRPLIRLSDRATSDSPALAVTTNFFFGGPSTHTLHMAWKGTEDDKQIYIAELDGNQWSPQVKVPNGFSYLGPALCEVSLGEAGHTTLMMAWRGVHGDLSLYWATRSVNGVWSQRSHLANFGSTHRPALTYAPWTGPVMAWKGIDGDARVWFSYFQNGGWTPQQAHATARTDQSPAIVAFQNRLYLFWKSAGDSRNVIFSSLDNSGAGDDIWTPPQRVEFPDIEVAGEARHPIGTTEAPSATVRGDRILLAWKGIDGDPRVFFTSFDGAEFGGQIAIAGSNTSRGPAICHADSFTHLAHRGDGDNHNLWWRAL